MAELRCDCCDLPLYSCGTAVAAIQAKEARARRQRVLQLPGVVRARQGGRCPSCGTSYAPGEPIRKTEDGWTGALCCPEGLDD